MKNIEKDRWPRRDHFKIFQQMDYPHFNVCAPVELHKTQTVVKQQGGSINLAIIYVLTRAANEIAPFRWRIRGDEIVEHDSVQASFTVMGEDELFGYSTVPYQKEYARFSIDAASTIEKRERERVLEDVPGQDDLLFMSGLPWIVFTSIVHPIHMHPTDSIPRLSWGKFVRRGERVEMPMSVQVHHGLMDGVHVGQYFQLVQNLLDQPSLWYSV